jgi:photosystem II stability/assembly factor-like uncharacterized protein
MIKNCKLGGVLRFLPRSGVSVIALVVAGLAFSEYPTGAMAEEFYQMDHAAIVVKNPAHAPLIAITKAGTRLVAVGEYGIILLSDDNGRSWRQANSPTQVLLTDVYFKSDKEGWAVGHYGVILHTIDGGETWTKVVDGLDIIKQLHGDAVQAQPDDALTPALMQRVDTAYTEAGPSKPVLAVGACDGGVLAAGQQDLAMREINGDWQEWTSKIDNTSFNNIYAIAPDGDKTLLAGENGMVLQSQNGCSQFKVINFPAQVTLFGILPLTPGDFFIYGLNGTLLQTTDDGETWRTYSIPPDQVLDSGTALHNGRVLIGAVNGRLYLSDPSLTKFELVTGLTLFEIAALTTAPNGNVVAVGATGVTVIPVSAL